ncbi:MAG: MBL fold metallo-hydrolase, partial [bacterium]
MIIELIEVGPFMENAYILGCEETKEAFVIDPGDEAGRILERVGHHGLNVVKIINTHAHIDHIGAVQEIKEKTGVKFYLHETEVPFAEAYDQQCRMFGVRFGRRPEVDGTISEGDELKVGNIEVKIIHTPGHSA